MTTPRLWISLRPLPLIDAATCAVMGLALELAGTPLATVTGLPTSLLR